VCCESAGRFFTVPMTDCPRDAIVGDDHCVPDTVCCEDAGGVGGVAMSAASDCPGPQRVALARCQGQVCCRDGVDFAYRAVCDAAERVSDELCDDPYEVCCDGASGLGPTPLALCPAASVEPFARCASDVCCATDAGPVAMPGPDCAADQILPYDRCTADTTCCQVGSGRTSRLFRVAGETCSEGTPVAQEFCDEPICCQLPDRPRVTSALKCSALGADHDTKDTCGWNVCCSDGTQLRMRRQDACDRDDMRLVDPAVRTSPCFDWSAWSSCCQTRLGPTVLPSCEVSRRLGGGACTHRITCCMAADGMVSLVSNAAACNGTVVPESECNTGTCCERNAGEAQYVAAYNCPLEHRRPNDECLAPACCDVPRGAPWKAPEYYCHQRSFDLLPLAKCDPSDTGKVCCSTPSGFVERDRPNCPGDTFVDDDVCRADTICCYDPTRGVGAWVAPSTCAQPGFAVEATLCGAPEEQVCCLVDEVDLHYAWREKPKCGPMMRAAAWRCRL